MTLKLEVDFSDVDPNLLNGSEINDEDRRIFKDNINLELYL